MALFAVGSVYTQHRREVESGRFCAGLQTKKKLKHFVLLICGKCVLCYFRCELHASVCVGSKSRHLNSAAVERRSLGPVFAYSATIKAFSTERIFPRIDGGSLPQIHHVSTRRAILRLRLESQCQQLVVRSLWCVCCCV